MGLKRVTVITSISFASLSGFCFGGRSVFAHQGHKHPSSSEGHPSPNVVPRFKDETTVRIQSAYQQRVQPIFEKKCLQCHGGEPTFPWYYNVPGVKQLIERDLKESKEHLDFSKGYPFISHATPIEDLQAIRESVETGSMPPFLYCMGHPMHRLSADEKQVVVRWTDEGVTLLQSGVQKPAQGGEK